MNAQKQTPEVEANAGQLDAARSLIKAVLARAVPEDFAPSVVITDAAFVVGWFYRRDPLVLYQCCVEAGTARGALVRLLVEVNWEVERARARRAMRDFARGFSDAGVCS